MYINRKDQVAVFSGEQELKTLSEALLIAFGRMIEQGVDPYSDNPAVKMLKEMYFTMH